MAKLLNLEPEQRLGCRVTFNVNRFEVYAAAGWLMTCAKDVPDLKAQLSENSIVGAMFDAIAQRKYLGL